MNTTHWDIARMANTMAMKCTVELSPEHITPRVKSSIKRQLRAGVITGGYRSEAAKIAEQIVGKFDLPVLRKQWRGLRIGTINMEQKQRVADIFRADWTSYILERPELVNHRYYKERYAKTMDDLTRASSSDFFISFNQSAFSDQANAILTESITPKQWQQIEQAVALLDSNEPIHITTYQ